MARWPGGLVRWLRAHDPGLSALRRGGRAAIVVPVLVGVAHLVTQDPTPAIFAGFGAIATLLFVDFAGPMRVRVLAQTSLVVASAALVALGTLASATAWSAASGMAVLTFVVLFSAIVSSVLATATLALLVSFMLAITVVGPASSIPDRLIGWAVAGVVSIAAVRLLWPAPARTPLRTATAQACTALAARLRSDAECALAEPEAAGELAAARDEARTRSDVAVVALRESFLRTPYRPTGVTTSARTLARLIEDVLWLATTLDHDCGRLARPPLGSPAPTTRAVCLTRQAAARLLERSAASLTAAPATAPTPGHDAPDLDGRLDVLDRARAAMERGALSIPGLTGMAPTAVVEALDPSFRAQQIGAAVAVIARNVALIAAGDRRGCWQHLIGRRPTGSEPASVTVAARVRTHLAWQSVTLHNSLRGAVALGLAVLLGRLLDVHHAFWVVFGTAAVLRSNAGSTGQSVLRAVGGTVVGSVIGSGLIAMIGSHLAGYWAVLPLAVLFAGLAPAAISFAAGQAGFTVVLLVLLTLTGPPDVSAGLLRAENVALGSAVSLLVGALFWPRGAGASLGPATAEAMRQAARQLHAALGYALSRCDALTRPHPAPTTRQHRAAAAARRLDDAFRGFLAERGPQRAPLAEAASLINSVTVLRRTADAIVELWRDGVAPAGDRARARQALLEASDRVVNWYERTAAALTGFETAGGPPDDGVVDRLAAAVGPDLLSVPGDAAATAVKMIWTADHIAVLDRQARNIAESVDHVSGPRGWLSR